MGNGDDASGLGPTAAAGGIGSLRRALDSLLQDREPVSTLSADLEHHAQVVPGSDWKAVVEEVIEGLLVRQRAHDHDAISHTFNSLAGFSADSTTLPGVESREPLQIRQPARIDRPDSTISLKPRSPVSISIDASNARTLKVIKYLPSVQLCQLEGRNGIGKTLAAKLLELISGGQPYATLPRAWKTLKEQLGRTTIEVVGLPEGLLKFTLTPGEWSEDVLDPLGDRLGTVTLDGEQIDWNRARGLFKAARISGDESLVDALARALEARAQQALRLRTKITTSVDDWHAPLLDLQEATDSLSVTYFQAQIDAAAHARSSAESTQRDAVAAHAMVERATRANDTLQSAIQRRVEVPPLITRLTDCNERLAANALRQKQVIDELLTASRALGLDRSRREQIARWERLRTLRYRALQRARSDEDWYLVQLGDDHRPDPKELLARQQSAMRQRQDALNALAELDVTNEVRSLGQAIERPLAQASTTVLRQVVAITDTSITGKSLLDGIRRRRKEIDSRPTSAEVRAAKESVDSAERTAKLLYSLSSSIEVTDRKQYNLSVAESTLRALLDELRGSQESYEEILDRLRQLQELRTSLTQERDGLRRSLARLLGVSVPDAYELGSSASKSQSLAEEEAAEEEDLLSGSLVLDETEQLNELSLTEQDSLGLPIDVDDWESIWTERIDDQRRQLERFGYRFSSGLLRSAPSTNESDELTEALIQAGSEAQQSLELEREKATQADEALDRLELQLEALAQSRGRLYSSAKAIISPVGRWEAWLPGVTRLIDVSGCSRDDVEALASVTPISDSTGMAEAERAGLRWMETISWLCTRISFASDGVRDALDSITGVLTAQAHALSPRNRPTQRMSDADGGTLGNYKDISTVRQWAEEELAILLNAVALRETLFDDAAEVRVELESATVSWHAKNSAEESRRPLEAFSSGEQVFAYTRARLDDLNTDESWRGHRLVVLDEFGAFVARNRLAQLLKFVREEALGTTADQVIVMLPLSADFANEVYAQELIRGTLEDRRRSDLLDRINQVKNVGYFAVPVEVSGDVSSG